MNVKQQEAKFVEWSKGVSRNDYDVAIMIDRLKQRKSDDLQIADIGGGIGSVARAIATEVPNASVDVIDNSVLAGAEFIDVDNVRLVQEDFFRWRSRKSYDAVIFRTVLHHFVGRSSSETFRLQVSALHKARTLLTSNGVLFVTENFYESWPFEDLTGEIIYQLTGLVMLAPLLRALGANTAGEGVRFRSYSAWQAIFRHCGFEARSDVVKQKWWTGPPAWQKLPLLCTEVYQGFQILEKSSSPTSVVR